MFEKVNPEHPDKVADRIAGAIVDLAYQREENPKVAVEVLIGHGYCYIIIEGSVVFDYDDIDPIVQRITRGKVHTVRLLCNPQDKHLADNQQGVIKCGDNGIFRGVPSTIEQAKLAEFARMLFFDCPFDGKYIIDEQRKRLVVCQSNTTVKDVSRVASLMVELLDGSWKVNINPLGDWTGGIDVDSGATNRKLGSDMGDAVTGGGLHGKDLSKADVSVNIYAHLKAVGTRKPVEITCAIGDDTVDGHPYSEIVDIARQYIRDIGGFEKFAEWGLIR